MINTKEGVDTSMVVTKEKLTKKKKGKKRVILTLWLTPNNERVGG